MRQLRGHTFRVLLALHDAGEALYGLQVDQRLNLPSSTTRPALARLLREGWVSAWWEPGTRIDLGRQPRRYWKITADGRTRLNKAQLSDALSED